jgi:YYY domain-containing protein
LNRFMPLAPFVCWLLLVWAIGYLALPLSRRVWPSLLPDGGLAAGRVLALCLWSLAAFWLGQGGVPVRVSAWLIHGFALLSLWLWWREKNQLKSLLRERLRGVVASELIFFAAFAFFFVLRGFWPAIDNGEKPMDMALISACARADFLPPPNSYAAGERLGSYYYFGHLQTALLSDAIGAAPRWTYNLMCATLPALCFSLLASLAGAITSRVQSGTIVAFGVLACGTLEPWRQWAKRWGEARSSGTPFSIWPINYWDTSRVIPYWHTDGPHYAISEYPWFTFNYGDLHAHYFSQPLSLLLIALGWALFHHVRDGAKARRWNVAALLSACVLGAQIVTNTWDFPAYFLLIALCVAPQLCGRNWKPQLPKLSGAIVSLGLVSLLVASPFLLRLHSAANPPRPLEQPASPLGEWLLVWGVFIGLWSLTLAKAARPSLFGIFCGAALFCVTWLLCGQPAYVLTLLLLLIAWTLVSLFSSDDETHRFLCRVALCGLLALLWSETTWAGFLDKPNHRQDTIFKFGLQAWYLLGTASLCGAVRWLHDWETRRVLWLPFTKAGLALLFLAPLIAMFSVPLARARARLVPRADMLVAKRHAPPQAVIFDFRVFVFVAERWDGWDAWAHLSRAEKGAAQWLHNAARDGENMVEAEQKEGGDYTEFSRYTHMTGVPTVIGPQAHTFQWGLDWDKVFERKNDVRAFYLSGRQASAEREKFLQKYGVKFVVLGELERKEYGENAMAWLERALIFDGYTAVTFTDADYDERRVTIFYLYENKKENGASQRAAG